MSNPAWIALLINMVVAVLGALQAADWIHIVGSEKAGWIALAIAAANGALHAITEPGVPTKLGQKLGVVR